LEYFLIATELYILGDIFSIIFQSARKKKVEVKKEKKRHVDDSDDEPLDQR
jgi:hypothetical protein